VEAVRELPVWSAARSNRNVIPRISNGFAPAIDRSLLAVVGSNLTDELMTSDCPLFGREFERNVWVPLT
jgi:hypothetical protein